MIEVWYQPVQGGLITLDKGERAEKQVSMAVFLQLRQENKLVLNRHMGTGYPIFHGKTDAYRFVDEKDYEAVT